MVIAETALGVNYLMTNAFADVPGFQIVVPGNSGPCDIEIVGGLTVNINSGTNAVAVMLWDEAQIVDEGNVLIAYYKWTYVQVTAASKNVGGSMVLRGSVGNFVADKTYRVQAKMNLAGTLAAAGNIFTSQSGFPDPILRAMRR